MPIHRPHTAAAAFLALLAAAAPALAQFGVPGSTRVREKLVGRLLSAEGVPAVAANDELGAFFNNRLVGAFKFTDSGNAFSLIIYGDDPATEAVEGPRAGAAIQFRYFRASTNNTRSDLRVENDAGEVVNYRYGGELIEIPDGLPLPFDLTPTRNLNLRIGATSDGGSGGNDPKKKNKYDVNGDGRVDEADAAIVLRVIISGVSNESFFSRRRVQTSDGNFKEELVFLPGIDVIPFDETVKLLDVNGDGRIDTRDAVDILRNRSN